MLNLSRCIRHRGPDWSGCVVALHGDSKVQKTSDAKREARQDDSTQGPHDYSDDGDDEDERGSILCHERLAIVGVGE